MVSAQNSLTMNFSNQSDFKNEKSKITNSLKIAQMIEYRVNHRGRISLSHLFNYRLSYGAKNRIRAQSVVETALSGTLIGNTVKTPDTPVSS